jgi:RTX calcium-binding nonapeptide repeat (4 copies)
MGRRLVLVALTVCLVGGISYVPAMADSNPAMENYHSQAVVCTDDGDAILPSPAYAQVIWQQARYNPYGYEQHYVWVDFWNEQSQRLDVRTGWMVPWQVMTPFQSPADVDVPPQLNIVLEPGDLGLQRAFYQVRITYGWYWANSRNGPWNWTTTSHWLQWRTTPDSEYASPGGGIFGYFGDQPDCATRTRGNTFALNGDSARNAVAASQNRLAQLNSDAAMIHKSSLAMSEPPLIECLPNATGGHLRSREPNVIVGTEAADSLVGTSGRDVILGLGGDDILVGLSGPDLICGGEGDDGMVGNDGNDRLVGANGDDAFLGGGGVDFISGGNGTDIMEGGAGNDRLLGGGDDLDVIAYLSSPAAVGVNFVTGKAYGGEASDHFIGFNAVVGSEFDDWLKGTSGEQWFVPLGGDDTVDGGADTDIIGYFLATQGVDVDLGRGTAEGEGTDGLSGLEVVFGSPFIDSIFGDDSPNFLFGDVGDDVIDGGLGVNTLTGDVGTDTCTNGEVYVSCENQGEGTIGPAATLDTPRPDQAPDPGMAVPGGPELPELPPPTVSPEGNAQ